MKPPGDNALGHDLMEGEERCSGGEGGRGL